MKTTTTAGIIGFGMSGKVFHAPFLATNRHFRLKCIVQRHGDEAKRSYPGIDLMRDPSQMLEDPEIELVVVGVPNDLHARMTRQCLEAGKHVVVEKPFTCSSAEADELIALSGKTGKHIFVYQNRRWDGDFLTVSNVIREGLLGELLEYEAHFDRYRPVPTGKAWREEPRPGSGVLFDLGPHLIDQALVLFGNPDAVFADIRTQRPRGKVDDYFEIKLFYNTLKVTLKAGVFVMQEGPRYSLHGREGSFIKYGLDPQEERLKQGMIPEGEEWGKDEEKNWGLLNTRIKGTHYKRYLETEPGNYHGFYNNVHEVLVNNVKQAVTPEEALNVIRIIELARESQESKKIIPYSK